MNKKIEILNRQSMLDVALQTTGSVEAIFDLSEQNDVPVSDEVVGLSLQAVPPINNIVVKRYAAHEVTPATDITPQDLKTVPYGGIELMGIEIDFIIS